MALFVLGACSSDFDERPFTPGTDELVWPAESQGCDAATAPKVPDHYDERAIAVALTWVYRDHPVEAFCGCSFKANQTVRLEGCGYQNPDDPGPTAIRWHAIVPFSRFGIYRGCWNDHAAQDASDLSARRYCARVDPEFREMEADLYNFLPVIGALGEKRADNPFGTVTGRPPEYGACDFGVMSVMGKSSLIQPPKEVRGDIARTYLYMLARYGKGKDWKIKLTPDQKMVLDKWNVEDPVDEWEKMRACRIQAIQGWENPYVK
jgi:deoxyribonuclease I